MFESVFVDPHGRRILGLGRRFGLVGRLCVAPTLTSLRLCLHMVGRCSLRVERCCFCLCVEPMSIGQALIHLSLIPWSSVSVYLMK